MNILESELLSPEYAELVKAQNYPAIANKLNKKELVDNPEKQQTIPKPLTLIELFQQITPAEALEIAKVPGIIDRIERAANENNRVGLQSLFFIIGSLLSNDSKIKIEALLKQTELDPNYQPTILGESRTEKLGIYPVTDINVQEVLNDIE